MLFSSPLFDHFYATADVLWWSTIGISGLFLLACHFLPQEIAPIQSMPWTFQWRRNLDLISERHLRRLPRMHLAGAAT